MTRLDALRALEPLVANGATGRELDRALIWAAFGRDLRPLGEPIGRIIDYILDPDDMRALGAAKALHEAVLPGWDWECMNAGWDFAVSKGDPCRGNYACFDACSPTPARAWLLAVIRALIAEGRA